MDEIDPALVDFPFFLVFVLGLDFGFVTDLPVFVAGFLARPLPADGFLLLAGRLVARFLVVPGAFLGVFFRPGFFGAVLRADDATSDPRLGVFFSFLLGTRRLNLA